jgi:hypothetical protein
MREGKEMVDVGIVNFAENRKMKEEAYSRSLFYMISAYDGLYFTRRPNYREGH